MPECVVVITPIPTREYGPTEVIGVFTNELFAQDHIDNNIELGDGWQAEVVAIENPDEDGADDEGGIR